MHRLQMERLLVYKLIKAHNANGNDSAYGNNGGGSSNDFNGAWNLL